MAADLQKQNEYQNILSRKELRNWDTNDCVLWVTFTNDGIFAKCVDIIKQKKINGLNLMSLDTDAATKLLGTTHQVSTFVQSISHLKLKNARRMKKRKSGSNTHSRKGKTYSTNLNIDLNALKDLPMIKDNKSSAPTNYKRKYKKKPHRRSRTMHSLKKSATIQPRSTTPTAYYSNSLNQNNNDTISKSNTTRTSLVYSNLSPSSQALTHVSSVSPTSGSATSTKKQSAKNSRQLMRLRSLSAGTILVETEPTDKKILWRKYCQKELYSGFLFKRGVFNKSFKKRWFVLVESNNNNNNNALVNGMRSTSNSMIIGTKSTPIYSNDMNSNDDEKLPSMSNPVLHSNYSANAVVNVNLNNNKKNYCYLFYFNSRPVKNELPKGFINLLDVLRVIGLMKDNDDNSKEPGFNKKSSVKYTNKKKNKNSNYFEIVLKTKKREWILGAIDSKSYIDWLIRLKKFHKKK